VLSLLFLRFWLFGIYVNCFESALFDRGNPIWFFLLSASCGLHFLARAQSRFRAASRRDHLVEVSSNIRECGLVRAYRQNSRRGSSDRRNSHSSPTL
jgi:hypothetical protein